jgi:oligopeptidase A
MTTTTNPLLQPGALPDFPAIQPAHVVPAIEALIAEYRAEVERVVADPEPPRFETLMAPLEHMEDRLARAWAPVGHLHGVKDSPELREAYGEAEALLTDHSTELGQHQGLYRKVRQLRESPAFAALDRARRTIVDDSLRGFRFSGVGLPEAERARFKALQAELTQRETAFEEAVLDATDAWHREVSEAELAGLPDSARAMLARAAAEAGATGWRATLKGPVVQAILSYAEDRGLREAVYTAYQTRASDQGPHAGRFDNAPAIEAIMALRHEEAQLLGLPSAAHLSMVDKMAGSPERVLGFLRELAAKARPVAAAELDALRAWAREHLGLGTLEPWDVGFAAERLREARYAFSEEDLKPWFAADAVVQGMFDLVGGLLGFTLRPAEAPVWHPDARYYTLHDLDGRERAGVYVDLYARTGKRSGAWMDVCRTRMVDGAHVQRPVAFLTCNFAPPAGDGTPALLTHDDVVTLFHEFGHGLHHLLTEVDWPAVGGISGVEWDAVELPSQFMENFAWDRGALDRFARHWRTGEALPDELFAKMTAARHFHAGLFLARQLEFALFDFRLHLEFDPAAGARTLELLESVRDEVAVLRPPSWQRFPMGFTHVFAGGYSAGYYSYLWAEVLSADAWQAFEEAGVFDAATGARWRREVLAVGGSRPALESFKAFRGREPDPGALLRAYGLAA